MERFAVLLTLVIGAGLYWWVSPRWKADDILRFEGLDGSPAVINQEEPGKGKLTFGSGSLQESLTVSITGTDPISSPSYEIRVLENGIRLHENLVFRLIGSPGGPELLVCTGCEQRGAFLPLTWRLVRG